MLHEGEWYTVPGFDHGMPEPEAGCCPRVSGIPCQDLTTVHAGARPSHAVWQGQIVSLSGRRGYLSLADIGYGSGDGFGGWNCRHDWFPFFEDVSERAYSDADLKKLNEPSISYRDKMYTEYELSQMQRAMEREIRKQKRAVLAAKEGIDAAETDEIRATMQELFAQESVKLKREERKLREFLQETGLQPENARLWVHGFGRSVSQRAVWANRKAASRGMVHGSLFTEMLEEYNNGQNDTIQFRNIEKELEKSEIGREFKRYLLSSPCKINIFYNVDADDGLLGIYDEITDEIYIYASNTKTVARTAEVIIHELTHRRYQIGGSFWAESVCRAHEYMHRNRRKSLTEAERRCIIKEIKETYAPLHPDWKWR